MLSSEMLRLEEMERTLYPLAGGLAHEVVKAEYRRIEREVGDFGDSHWEALVQSVYDQVERATGRRLPIGTRDALRKVCGLTSANPHY